MFTNRWPAFALLLSLLAGTTARATPEEQTFTQLYGSRMKLASTPAQKVDFARQLLKDASDLSDDKPLQTYLCTKAYDLAMTDREGYPVALNAMTLLGRSRPEMKALVDEKTMAVLEKQLRSGPMAMRRVAADEYVDRAGELAEADLKAGNPDAAVQVYQKALPAAQLSGKERANDLSDRIKAIHLQQAARKSGADLKAKLAANPQDGKAATDLVRLLVLDMDNPAEAAEYVSATGDAELRNHVLLAAKAGSDLTEAQCLDLAGWYRTQSAHSGEVAAAVALARSKLLYQQYLKIHVKEDSPRLSAKMSLSQVSEELSRIHLPGSKHTVDLLALFDAEKDALAGKWTRNETGVSCAAGGFAKIGVPYLPPQEYDYRVTFKRALGTAVFLEMVQRNKVFVWVACAWDGITSGFELIAGKQANENATTTKLPQMNDLGVHTAVIRVRTDSIAAYLDGTLVGQYLTDGSDLSTPDTFSLEGYALGFALGASAAPTQITEMVLTEISGKGHPMAHRK